MDGFVKGCDEYRTEGIQDLDTRFISKCKICWILGGELAFCFCESLKIILPPPSLLQLSNHHDEIESQP